MDCIFQFHRSLFTEVINQNFKCLRERLIVQPGQQEQFLGQGPKQHRETPVSNPSKKN